MQQFFFFWLANKGFVFENGKKDILEKLKSNFFFYFYKFYKLKKWNENCIESFYNCRKIEICTENKKWKLKKPINISAWLKFI